jgi:PKD repeat protein
MNTEEDSDGNGIPNDDIDNKNHPSFKDGSLFSFPLRRVDGDRTVQLTIVSKEGKGSRIQRRFSWVSEEDILHTDSFRLYTSHKAGFTGEPIYFGIDGIKESYGFEIKWDFDGDKKADYTSASPLASFVYEAPGVYTALVQVKHIERSILKYQELEIHITERVPGISQYQTPISNFTVSLSDNLVTLVNTSVIEPNLSENNMKYAWKFGDGSSSFEKNPEHRYQTPGQYIIRLDIEDELGQKHSKQSVVTIQTIAPFLPEESNENPFQEETEDSSDTSNTENTDTPTLPQKEELKEEGTSFLTLFFLGILIILGLSLCMFIGALVYFKIKTPDYTIGEIIEELKERVLSFVEGRPYEPPSEEILSTGNEIKEATERVLQKEEEQNEDEEKPEPITETLEEKTPETPPKKEESDSKIPSWLQENDEEKPENSNTEEDSVLEEDDDDDIPDWLK